MPYFDNTALLARAYLTSPYLGDVTLIWSITQDLCPYIHPGHYNQEVLQRSFHSLPRSASQSDLFACHTGPVLHSSHGPHVPRFGTFGRTGLESSVLTELDHFRAAVRQNLEPFRLLDHMS